MTDKKPIQILTSLPSEWHLIVSETKQLNGILVFQTPFGKVYTRLMTVEEIVQSKGRFVFEILNPQSMKALNFSESEISIQESFLEKQLGKQKAKPYYVEESVSESESEQDRLARIRKESEKFMEEQKKKQEQDSKVVINLYGKGETPETTTEKLEGVENPEAINDSEDLAEKKIQAFQKFGDKRMLEAKTREELVEMIDNHINDLERRSNARVPSGSIPLTSEQLGYESSQDDDSLIDYRGSVLDLSFDSYEQMCRVLKARMDKRDERSAESEQLLNELIRKQAKAEKGSEYEFSGGARDFCKKKGEFRKRE